MSLKRWSLWAGLVLSLVGFIGGDAPPEYFAVCDAGSTGTRLYIFLLDTAKGKAKSVFVKKTKPGLSSYKDEPHKALAPLMNLLREGAEEIPQELRATTPLTIFGTAGMRLLPAEVQEKIWSSLRKGLTEDPDFPFRAAAVEARTVSGDEEGLWAVLTTNFLTGRMRHDLVSHGLGAPLGLMDLGGSSTQIGIPSPAAAQKGINFSSGVLVRSYLGFGMTHIQQKVRKAFGKDLSCYMPGTSTEEEGTMDGDRFGDAPNCRKLIGEMLKQETASCQQNLQADSACLGDLSGNEASRKAIQGDVDFYAVSGLTYVIDFVRWWLESSKQTHALLESYPHPSLTELRSAVDVMCSGDYSLVEGLTKGGKAQAHRYTGFDNLPFRCFQANYILVLLGEIYGFAQDGRKVTFAVEVEGEDLEWPLGALLHGRAAAGVAETAGEL